MRVHLEHVGHAIVGDPRYGPDPKKASGPVVDRPGNTREEYEENESSRMCPECHQPVYDDPALFRIHLHALRYTCPEFDFAAETPEWAMQKEKEKEKQ